MEGRGGRRGDIKVQQHRLSPPAAPETARKKEGESPSPPVWDLRPKGSVDLDAFLGNILVKGDIISKDALSHALKVQKEMFEKGRPLHLGLILVKLGYASESTVVTAINQHFDLSVNSLTENIAHKIQDRRGIKEGLFPRPRIPIWMQLSMAMTIVILLTVTALSWVTINQQKEQLYTQTVRLGTVSLNYFANNARIPLLEDNVLGLNSLIREATDVEGIRYAIIINAQGRVMAHSDHDRLGETFQGFNTGQVRYQEKVATYFRYIAESGENLLNMSRKITFKEQELGEVHVGVSLDFIRGLVAERTLSIAAVGAVVLFFSILIAVGLGFHFSRPVKALAEATKEISQGNYRHRVTLHRNDELGSLAVAFNRMSRQLWKTSLMQKTFGKYVGADVLDMIMANPEIEWLKGHRREVTILLTDIRGFTAFSEGREPEEIVERLNEYLEIATATILHFGGYVDKFIGDAVLGVFGVPVYHKDHVERGVRASLEIQRALSEAARQGDNPLLTSVGIGVNTGVAVAGNIGSQVKMEYTVIGDTVNLASRINGLARAGETILSQTVLDYLGDRLAVEPLPPQKLKGKTGAVTLYKLQGIDESSGKEA